jgi:uncharacterized protein YdeI (YjbR/CyaY-like superfamily)
MLMKPTFFTSAARFQQWLEKNHDKKDELLVGFHKKASGKKSVTYPEALDEALAFGWIDGVRKSLDDTSYTIRFTPRRPRSIWSLVNTKRVEELTKLGRMKPSGLKAFALRDPKRTGIYAFETTPQALSADYEKTFRSEKQAWEFFQKQPPGYRRTAIFWVMNAKQEQTRLRRLGQLISDSAEGRRLGVIDIAKKGK